MSRLARSSAMLLLCLVLWTGCAAGRLLAYLWLPSAAMFNLGMLAEGYAREHADKVPYKHQDQFKGAERYAREKGLGLWSPSACGASLGH